MSRDFPLVFRLVCIALGVLMILAGLGCGSREVSSTDHHNRIPQLNCAQVKYDNSYHRVCCDYKGCSIN